MILSYKVANYKSIKEPVELSFLADKGSEFIDTNTFNVNGKINTRILKSLFLFGANASGKSNILESLCAFNLVMRFGKNNNHRGAQEYWSTFPYIFDDVYRKKPTVFELKIGITQNIYLYHLEITQEKLVSEILFIYEGKRKKKIYSVSGNTITLGKNISEDEKEKLEKIASWTKNKTFLAAIAREEQKSLAEFNEIYWQISNIIYVKYPSSQINQFLTVEYMKTKQNKEKVIDLMRNADSCINDIIVEEDKNSNTGYNINFEYLINGKPEYINYNMESDGNRKLFNFAAVLLVATSSRKEPLLVIDELDTSLHPCIIDDLINNFMRTKGHKQLVASMHYTGLMDCLRRDQIVIVEKDKKELATTAFTMADFTGVRKDLNKEKAYLRGIFGGTPFTSFNFNVKGGK